ncbi:hypothetical protein HPB50_007811 [Hyalomma asiaticum]|uniref:Uncharacterized protein n=1 Tax=Hyalomma asiaticum TaxID=266040 RepID=A0ACB7SUD4_HYAAI|nr:hypothetical protein HPB50_007811 [Hyalomma asiaticum]
MCPVLRLLLLLLLSLFQRQLLRRTTTKTQALRLHRIRRTLPQPLRRHVVFSGRRQHREHLHRFVKTRLPAQQTELVLRTWTQAYRRLNDCLVPTRLPKTASVWDFPASENRTSKWGLSEKSNDVTPRALARTKPVTAVLRRSGRKNLDLLQEGRSAHRNTFTVVSPGHIPGHRLEPRVQPALLSPCSNVDALPPRNTWVSPPPPYSPRHVADCRREPHRSRRQNGVVKMPRSHDA